MYYSLAGMWLVILLVVGLTPVAHACGAPAGFAAQALPACHVHHASAAGVNDDASHCGTMPCCSTANAAAFPPALTESVKVSSSKSPGAVIADIPAAKPSHIDHGAFLVSYSYLPAAVPRQLRFRVLLI